MTSTVQLEVRVAKRHFITAVPSIKLFAWGEGDSGGPVLLYGIKSVCVYSDSGGYVLLYGSVCLLLQYLCKAVRVGQKSETMCVYYYCRNPRLCVFIAAVPITKLFARICCRNSGNFLNLGKFRTF